MDKIFKELSDAIREHKLPIPKVKIVVTKELTDLVQDHVDKLPISLFKYSSLDGVRKSWMENLIIKSQLYFARPSQLNDPLEFRFPVTYKNISPLKARSRWRKRLKELLPYVEKKTINRDVDELLNDLKTEDGRDKQREKTYQFVDNTSGVASFSTDALGMLMWSYYANGHTGIAVRFRMDIDNLGKIGTSVIPLEVRYDQSFPEIDCYELDSNVFKFLSVMFGTKSKSWEHEHEWRLIANEQGNIQLPSSMIDGLILGMKISKEDKGDVIEWVKNRGDGLEVFEVINKRGSFDLDMIPVNY